MASASINFVGQHQQQDLWCWAAVGAAMSSYYNVSIAQCSVVNYLTGETACCIDGASPECDQRGDLRATLAALHILRVVQAQITASAIVDELRQGRPVGARFEWANGGAHVFTIVAADDVTQIVRTEDPWYYRGDFSMADLRGNYQDNPGTWTHTYLTTPTAGIYWTPSLVPFLALPLPGRLGVRSGKRAVRIPIYDLGTNNLRDGFGLKDANATPYDKVLDGELAVDVHREGMRKTGAVEDRHDYRTALAMLGVENLNQEYNGAIRLLRVPGLYVFALWDVAIAGGRVVPVAPVPRFLPIRKYTEIEFTRFLQHRLEEIAEKRSGGDNDAP